MLIPHPPTPPQPHPTPDLTCTWTQSSWWSYLMSRNSSSLSRWERYVITTNSANTPTPTPPHPRSYMYVDPELLAELSDEQKQLLFVKFERYMLQPLSVLHVIPPPPTHTHTPTRYPVLEGHYVDQELLGERASLSVSICPFPMPASHRWFYSMSLQYMYMDFLRPLLVL